MADKSKTSQQTDSSTNNLQQNATGQNAATTAQQSQIPSMWNYHQMYNMNMYNMYNMNMYPNYNHPFYQMLASQGGYGNAGTGYQAANTANNPHMRAMEAYRNSFTSGGTLMSFNSSPQSSTSPAVTPTSSTADSKSSGKTNVGAGNSTDVTKIEEIELPPLPPGPPPPSVPPPPPPAPSPPPPPPPDTASMSSPQSPAVPPVVSSYPQYMAFNMNQPLYPQMNNKPYQQQSNQQYQQNKSQHNQQFGQNQQMNKYGQQNQLVNQFGQPNQQQNQFGQQNKQQQNQFGQNQQQNQYGQGQFLYPLQGEKAGEQQSNQNNFGQAGKQWGGSANSKPDKETRWSQPNQGAIRFNQPNNNRNNRFNNQQDGAPIRFNMNRPRGRLNANKGPLLPNPDWVAGKTKWQGNQNKLNQQQQNQPAKTEKQQATSSHEAGPAVSNEETLRKLVDGWPDNLKDYVDRCFAECPPNKKDKLTDKLKTQLFKAANNGQLWYKEWQFESMPDLDDDEDQTQKKGRLESRLGYSDNQMKSPVGKKKKKDRRDRGRSSSSESSHGSQEDYISFPAPTTSAKKKKNKEKKKNKYKHNVEDSHYWSEFGLMNGGNVETKKEVLDKRAARFNNDKGGGSGKLQAKVRSPAQNRITGNSGAVNSRLGHHSQGQGSPYRQKPSAIDSFSMDVDTDFDLSSCHIVGTCRDIEKPYLRLTTAPEPCQVRPPEVLKESLDFVKQKWAEGKDYRYICEQLKSIRQDLTVQGIRDAFTVTVYETHAKIALETGDHAEFNQCQSQLSLLHKEQNSMNRNEFLAYRLLYFIFTQDFMDVNTMLMSLSVAEKRDVCISHAVSVMKAWLGCNYDKMLRLYSTCPRMSSYLMDWFIARERKNALKVIIKAYRPSVPVKLLMERLAFENETKLMEFLDPLDIIYTDETKKTIDCKLSTTSLQA